MNMNKFQKENTDCMRPIIKYPKLISDGFKEPLNGGLCALPNEILLEILKKLDIKMLCRISQVNKQFNILTQDSLLLLLYTRLNMKLIDRSESYIRNIFCYFTSRCKYLQRLDLTCSEFRSSDFKKFLENCGEHLTHLRLSNCRSIDNLAADLYLKYLQKVDFTFCSFHSQDLIGFLDNCGKHLKHLRIKHHYLLINNSLVVKISQICKNLEELDIEYLNSKQIHYESVLQSLLNKNFRPNYTQDAINGLADCKNLRKVSLRSKFIANQTPLCGPRIDSSELMIFFTFCKRLEELHLDFIFFTKPSFDVLMQCKNLKKLEPYNCNIDATTYDEYSDILEFRSENDKSLISYKPARLTLFIHAINILHFFEFRKVHQYKGIPL